MSWGNFIPKDLCVEKWEDIAPYFSKLETQEINSKQELESFILHFSETIMVYMEARARSYVNMTCHTDNKEAEKREEIFNEKISPQVDLATDLLNKKILNSPYCNDLPQKRYDRLKKILKREIEIFCEKNVPLDTELSKLATRFEQMAGALTVDIDEKKLTMPQAQALLVEKDRKLRERVWKAIRSQRLNHKKEFDDLFSEMVSLRHQMALNAGYKNFRDFQHDALQRFDYTPSDTLAFHDSVEKYVMPVAAQVIQNRAKRLHLDLPLKPWDVNATAEKDSPLKPFQNGKDLLAKAIRALERLHSPFADYLKKMKLAGFLDLESRPHKAPGGYNYGFEVTGMPFIFMNAVGIHDDIVTFFHESGHAVQSCLLNDEPIIAYRDLPSEVAETASMSMELLSSDFWDEFYNKSDYCRARIEHLEDIILFLPWCVTVDAFQHWLYLHPLASIEERDTAFFNTVTRFLPKNVDWSGLENELKNEWHRQLHIFTNPFYYIEYGIAQLGALQMFRQYKRDPDVAVQKYKSGLKIGNASSIPEVWGVMGLQFNFSGEIFRELMEFVEAEIHSFSTAH